jgi:hypothetical protein
MDRPQLLRTYAAAADDIRRLVEPLTDEELDRRPVDEPGGWTARQIVHHLADSEMTSAIRLRRLLVEDAPVITAYDENAFARLLHYDDRPIGPSLDALAAARSTSVQLLERLTEADWSRAGTHSESGRYGVEEWLAIYAAHGRDHADQIRRALGGS